MEVDGAKAFFVAMIKKPNGDECCKKYYKPFFEIPEDIPFFELP
jgi:hypothetical protein